MMTLTAGSYWGNLIAFGFSQSENKKKTPYIWLTWNVTLRAGAEDWERLEQPIERTINVYMSDAARPFSRPKLEALGFNGEFDDGKMDFSTEAKENGHELVAEDDHFDNKKRLKWDLPHAGGFLHDKAPAPLVTELNAKWQSENPPTPAGRPTAPPSTAPPPADAAPAEGDEPPPF